MQKDLMLLTQRIPLNNKAHEEFVSKSVFEQSTKIHRNDIYNLKKELLREINQMITLVMTDKISHSDIDKLLRPKINKSDFDVLKSQISEINIILKTQVHNLAEGYESGLNKYIDIIVCIYIIERNIYINIL